MGRLKRKTCMPHAIMKQEFTTAAEEEWLTDINRPNARRGAGGNKLRTYMQSLSQNISKKSICSAWISKLNGG